MEEDELEVDVHFVDAATDLGSIEHSFKTRRSNIRRYGMLRMDWERIKII